MSTPPLRSAAGVTVLTIGDVMLDEYVWGEVQRISPEAPVPVVQVQRQTHVPGGAANAAAGVVALGGRALLGGVVGADVHAKGADYAPPNGKPLPEREVVERYGGRIEFLPLVPERSTSDLVERIARSGR